jgi:hypothetical protein
MKMETSIPAELLDLKARLDQWKIRYEQRLARLQTTAPSAP